MRLNYFYGIFFLLMLSPFSSVSGVPAVTMEESNYIPVEELTTLDPLFTSSFNLSVAFMGITESDLNMSLLDSLIPQWYAPIDRIPAWYIGEYNYRESYVVNYDIQFLPTSDVLNYSQFIHSIETLGPRPGFDAIVNNTLFDNFTSFGYVPMDLVEQYLGDTYSFTQSSPSLFVIDTYSQYPDQFSPYFYNNSEFDLDVKSVPRPYGSNFMVAGGGHNRPLLWMDISAGPTDYRGQTWNHTSVYNGNITALTYDIASYIRTSLELRFLPSYIYTPISPNRNVRFEYILVDLARDGTNWSSIFRPDYIIEKYSQTNPFVSWSYSYSEWDYSGDQDFLTAISNARYTDEHSYDSWTILSYLDEVYMDMFNSSTEETTVIPNFIFAFPDDWMFDYLLGVAWSDYSGRFSYVVSAINQKWMYPGYDVEYVDWYNSYGAPDSLAPGDWTYIYSLDYEGAYADIFQTNLSTTAPLQVDILDAYNFKLFEQNQNYTAVDSFIVDGDFVKNTTLPYLSRYYWVLQPASSSSVNFQMKIDTYRDRAFGVTFIAMHEGGHAIGLPHPHDGWSWFNNEDYLDWLWDLSYSQMTYASHLSDISYLDIKTVQRGMFGVAHNETILLYNELVQTVKEDNIKIPESLFLTMSSIADSIFEIEDTFRTYANNPMYDNLTRNTILELVELQGTIQDLLDTAPWLFEVSFEILLSYDNYTFTAYLGDTLVLFRGTYSTLLSTFSKVGYTTYKITIEYGFNTTDILTGYTWELDGKTFDYRIISTTSSSSSSSDISTSSTSPLPFTVVLSSIVLALIITKRKKWRR